MSQLERDARDDVYSLIDEPEFAIFRIASHLALLALLNNFGGYQTTTSAAGKACIGFYLTGAGSPTDCGFQRVD